MAHDRNKNVVRRTFNVTMEELPYKKLEAEAKKRHIEVPEYSQNILLLHATLDLPKESKKDMPVEHYTAQNDDEPI